MSSTGEDSKMLVLEANQGKIQRGRLEGFECTDHWNDSCCCSQLFRLHCLPLCRQVASLLGSELAGPVRQAANLQEKEGKGKLNLDNPACTSNIQIRRETKIVLKQKMKDNMNIMPDSNVWGNKQELEGAVLNKGDYDLERLTET